MGLHVGRAANYFPSQVSAVLPRNSPGKKGVDSPARGCRVVGIGVILGARVGGFPAAWGGTEIPRTSWFPTTLRVLGGRRRRRVVSHPRRRVELFGIGGQTPEKGFWRKAQGIKRSKKAAAGFEKRVGGRGRRQGRRHASGARAEVGVRGD